MTILWTRMLAQMVLDCDINFYSTLGHIKPVPTDKLTLYSFLHSDNCLVLYSMFFFFLGDINLSILLPSGNTPNL